MSLNIQNRTESDSSDLYPVTMVGFDQALLLDIAGPLQVFSSANQKLSLPHYSVRVVTETGSAITTETGVTITADLDFDAPLPEGDLVVPGGPGVDTARQNDNLVAYLRKAAASQRRIISVCSGSVLLAEAGLLDGKEATSHWTRTDELRNRYPAVRWIPDAIFTQDGNTYCSAGVTAGIDLFLALVEADLGRNLALDVARELVVFLRRSGGQSQYSRPLRAQAAASSRIRDLCAEIIQNPMDDWRLPRMSDISNMTERSLHRHFVREFGESPSRFVEGIRVDLARTYLDHGGYNLGDVARLSGFGDDQTLRRAFARTVGVTPNDYRDRFGS